MTQIAEAQKGNITSEMRKVAKQEPIRLQTLLKRVATGSIVIPSNPNHEPIPTGIGEGLRVKVNANIGTSREYCNIDEEVKKATVALDAGSHALMDLSTGGNLDTIRKKLLDIVCVPFGTVPIYQTGIEAIEKHGAIIDMTEDDMFNTFEAQAKQGVDFAVVHVGVTKESVERLRHQHRLIPMVSRGGAFHMAWILHHQEENPLYKDFDYLIELAKNYDVTLSLGDGMRSGALYDSNDRAKIQELLIIGELVEKAPYFVLGPLVTDIAPGYDHFVGGIGGALAGYFGADFLCYLTPSEHLCLPDIDDVREGVIATRIAAHAADIARGIDRRQDEEFSKAREHLNWDVMFNLCIDKEKAQRYREKRKPTEDTKSCSMCGNLCAIELVQQYLQHNEE